MRDNWYRCIDVFFLRFHLVTVRKEGIPIWGATENGKEFKENKIVHLFYIQGVSISSHWGPIAKGNKGKPNGVGRKERKALPWDRIMWVKVHTAMSPLSFSSVQSLSCVRLFVTPLNCSTPGLPVHHQLLEFTQTHVHWVGDAIQLSHPLSSPSPPAFNLSQHQGLFKWVCSSHQVLKILEFQHQCFQWTPRTDLL